MIDSKKRQMKARIAEILNDYLMDPEEAYAECTLRFLKQNGETQEKTLRWVRPDLDRQITSGVISLADLMEMTPAEVAEADSYYWNKANEVITNRNKGMSEDEGQC